MKAQIKFADRTKTKVLTDWRPGDSRLRAEIDGEMIAVKVRATAGGYELRYRGASRSTLLSWSYRQT